ncbi:spermatogenesis-associated protein 17 [Periophthalmus magnuspinnatus]|uniref:spermatogenesis-associated protein 17 n=1 Tax=Periophthalmus magnuspinnatus TaxID=409849 RepID=UPI002436EFAF|nr:spermatogenesis-associated protein 17 [Periophthalmus magnuspinnatus]
MAGVLRLDTEQDFRQEYFYRNSLAEESREKENQAAIRIQSWVRACRVQAYISHLHKKAVIIQKIWRGFRARSRFRQMVKAAYFIMKMNFYEAMAVRIQRRWRGYYVRKYVHNFYARKSYLENISMKNKQVRRDLDELEELQRRERKCLEMVKEQTAKLYQAHRLHHLVSTKQCPGVFNSPFRRAPHEMELLLRQVKYQAPTRLNPRDRAFQLGTPGPAAPNFPETLGSPWIKSTHSGSSSRPVLPPIVSRKPQTSYTLLEDVQNDLRQHNLSAFTRPIYANKTLN